MATQEENKHSTKGPLLADFLTTNPDLTEQLALCLDREMRLIQNWKHLSWELKVDANVIKSLGQYSDFSPTIRLFEYLEATQPDLTIQQLKQALTDIRRNDLVSLLTTKAGYVDSEMVKEVITSSNVVAPQVDLLDDIVLALDERSKANWSSLAVKLGVSRQKVKQFERRSTESPTCRLFECLEVIHPEMTLRTLKDALKSMNRKDLLEILREQKLDDEVLIKDVLIPGSELFQTVEDKLNIDHVPWIPNWRELASHLKIPSHKYREFDGGTTAEKKSPTKEVLQLLKQRSPDLTLIDVVEALKKIQRNDAVQIITQRFPGAVGPSALPGSSNVGNLPYLTAYFTGRQDVVDTIIEKLTQVVNPSRMVIIVSLPGMGKTEVAICVSLLLRRKKSVIFIKRKKQNKLTDVCSQILESCGRHLSEMHDPVSIAKCRLTDLKEDTVIVLDNTEDIQGEEFDDFVEYLVKYAPKVQLILTSREDVGFTSSEIHKVSLNPLDSASSARLLLRILQESAGNSEELLLQESVANSEEHAKKLGELCGGIPLLLVHCAFLLKDGFSPAVLIQELRDNPMELLKSNAERIYNALGRFLCKFPDNVIENLVRVSVFPSAFSGKDIAFLFDDQLELETVKTKMVKCALLQKLNNGMVVLHPLVRDYCRAESKLLKMETVGEGAQHKFNHHYLELLRLLSKQFISKESALKAISAFRNKKANVMEAFKNCLQDKSSQGEKEFGVDVANSPEVMDFLAKVLSPPAECTKLYERCRDIATESGDQKRLADSLNSLGFRRLCDVAHGRGDRGTLEMFQQAYDIRMTLPKEQQKNETHANTICKLGLCYSLQGEEEKGRKQIQIGIDMRKDLGVPLYVAAGYCDLGNAYRECGDHQKAIDIWKTETLPVFKGELGDHPWTASILRYIAGSYKALADGTSDPGSVDLAVMYSRKALELRIKLLGVHQDTARSHVDLSDLLVIMAKDELQKALEIQKDLLGEQHESTMETLAKKNENFVNCGKRDQMNQYQ